VNSSGIGTLDRGTALRPFCVTKAPSQILVSPLFHVNATSITKFYAFAESMTWRRTCQARFSL
jgi:hypothetical protein